MEGKLNDLKNYIKNLGSVAVAYSGGVDSTFLLQICNDILGTRCMAITAVSPLNPQREVEAAKKFIDELGVSHVILETRHILDVDEFSRNDGDRCYVCKKAVFGKIVETARLYGIENVLDGSNYDDMDDYRPGMKAARELGVLSPLLDCKFTKSDIRKISYELGLPTWDKPALACLATRISHGERITDIKLGKIEKAEDYLRDLGFRQVRVRLHGNLARIEVGQDERTRFFDTEIMDKINARLTSLGFSYVSLDLKGYRTGSMNQK